MPLLLRESDEPSVLTMPDVIEGMWAALIALSTGRAQQPLRTVMELGANQSFFGVMPASLGMAVEDVAAAHLAYAEGASSRDW